MRSILIALFTCLAAVVARGQSSVADTVGQHMASEPDRVASCSYSVYYFYDGKYERATGAIQFGPVPVGSIKHITVVYMNEFVQDQECLIRATRTQAESPPFSGSFPSFEMYTLYDAAEMPFQFAPKDTGYFRSTVIYRVSKYSGDFDDGLFLEGYGVDPASGLPAESSPTSSTIATINHVSLSGTTIHISFSLSHQQSVRLVLYDLLGNQAAQLPEDRLEAGEHSAAFDCRDLPSGLYRVQVQTDNATAGEWVSVSR